MDLRRHLARNASCRMVRPATLGPTLISVGALDKKQYPTAQVVTKGNLVAVLSPNEWEAIGAANSVAATTSGPNGPDSPAATTSPKPSRLQMGRPLAKQR